MRSACLALQEACMPKYRRRRDFLRATIELEPLSEKLIDAVDHRWTYRPYRHNPPCIQRPEDKTSRTCRENMSAIPFQVFKWSLPFWIREMTH